MGSMHPASITAAICSRVPAVMLETVQQASLMMLFLCCVLALRMDCSAASALQLSTACVCSSVPVTMFPTVRSAGTSTVSLLQFSSYTSRMHRLAWMTACMLVSRSHFAFIPPCFDVTVSGSRGPKRTPQQSTIRAGTQGHKLQDYIPAGLFSLGNIPLLLHRYRRVHCTLHCQP